MSRSGKTKGSAFYVQLFFAVLSRLPVAELRPQLVNTEQFVPGLIYNVPEQSTQYSINIPDDREPEARLIPHEESSRQLIDYNYASNGDDISGPIVEDHKSRGHKSYSSNLAEELEGIALEDPEEAIPGEPKHDYPIYEEIPRTAFSCRGKHVPAYYADVEARCQVFHICDVGGQKHSFLCPNGSVFNQKYLVCDWWYDFTCDNAETLFDRQIIPTEINSVSPNIIESEKIHVVNHNDGFSTYVTPSNLHDGGYQITNGYVTDHELNRNSFDFPNTQIDIPQQIFTGNNYVPQNDIFHGAETGFPGRDLLIQNANGINNNDNNNNNNNINNNNNNNNDNNKDIKTEYTDKTKDEVKEVNFNQESSIKNKFNENSNDKSASKVYNENTTNKAPINPNTNINDSVNRKQQRIGRKGHDFFPNNRNTNIAGNNQDTIQVNTFQNNNKNSNNNEYIITPNDARINSNHNNNVAINNNQNFQQSYSTSQVQASPSFSGNEKQEIRPQSVPPQQQSNFAPPVNV